MFKIKRLLYDEGFTIAGARRHLRETNGAIGVEPSAYSAHAALSRTSAAAQGGRRNAAAGEATAPHGGHPENAGELLSRKMLLDTAGLPARFLDASRTAVIALSVARRRNAAKQL